MIGIFIPYRNRKEHLEILLDKLSKYENISIHILEQSNNELFNRGKLFNIGANEYLDKYDYFIFHDVDLIPQDENYNELYNDTFKSDISNNTFNNSQSESQVDIVINANPPTNILAERWGIRVYAISFLLKVRSVLVN
jgi:hypothetical protein